MEYPYDEWGCRQPILEFSYKGEVLCYKAQISVVEDPEECSFEDAFLCEGNKEVEREVNAAFNVWARAWVRRTPPNERYAPGVGYYGPPEEEFVKLIKGKVLRSEPSVVPEYTPNGDLIAY